MTQTFDEHERLSALYDLLIADLYQDKGLQAIADRGADMLENPVVILDTSFKVLAATTGFAPEGGGPAGHPGEKAAGSLKMNPQLHTISMSENPVLSDAPFSAIHGANTGHGWIDSAIRLHGIVVGYLSVYGANRPFTKADFKQVEKLVQFASMELQKSPAFLLNHGFPFEPLVIDLLEQRIPNLDTFLTRMRLIGKQLTVPYQVLVVSFSPGLALSTSVIPGIRGRLLQFFPEGISAAYHGNVVLLVPAEQEAGLAADMDGLLLFLEQNHLNLGVSYEFSNPLEMPAFYRQALFCTNTAADGPVRYYRDLFLDHILSLAGNAAAVRQNCSPQLLLLAESEKSADRELLRTLYLYLLSMKNADKVSQQMGIHKSTLFYRINKVKQLLSIDLDSGSDFVKTLVACKMLECLGLLPFSAAED